MVRSLETIRKDVVALLPRLRRFALSLTGNAADADDLVQDSVERALRNLHRWEEGTRLDSWMFRMTQNIWIDAVRARKVRVAEPIDDAVLEQAGIDGARDAEARLAFAATCGAMAKLPEEQRVAVALVCVEGMSYRDAADTLGVPIGTLTSRLFRARSALAEALAGEGASLNEALS
jgi:RNA polymerase sigma-70 factor, ECF subfamily